jgi:hypothetical protein
MKGVYSMSKDSKIDLVKAFMQVEGEVVITSTCNNYDLNGGVLFTGNKEYNNEQIKITMDKNRVEAINDCNTVLEIYKCYKEMEYF